MFPENTANIEKALREVSDLPALVESWRVETGQDSTGEDAVWVWVTLKDEDTDRPTRSRLRDVVREVVHHSLGKQEPWVYVRFRGASESEE